MADLIFGIITVLIGIGVIYVGFKAKESEPFHVNYLFVGIGMLVGVIGLVLLMLPVASQLFPNDGAVQNGDTFVIEYVPVINPDEVVFTADITRGLRKCREFYCFQVNITSVARGDITSFEKVSIKTDKYFIQGPYELSFSGVKRDGLIFVPNSNIVEILPPEEVDIQ